jgi:hypothetical protein
MEAVRTSETSVDNYFTRQYIPEDNSELHTRRRENLKFHITNRLATGEKDGPTSSQMLQSFVKVFAAVLTKTEVSRDKGL